MALSQTTNVQFRILYARTAALQAWQALMTTYHRIALNTTTSGAASPGPMPQQGLLLPIVSTMAQ